MKVTKSDIVDLLNLNEDQEAILGLERSTVVRAGAGAGKTTTLIGALLYDLLLTEIPAEEIAVATFTRSAADGLRSRSEEALYRLLGPDNPGIGDLWIGTIDALALRYLQTFSLRQGLQPEISPGRARDLKSLSRQALEKVLGEASGRGDALLRALAGEENLLAAFENLDRRLESQGVERFFVHGVSGGASKEEALQALEELALSGIGETSYEKVAADIAAIQSDRLEMVSQSKWGLRSGDLLDRALLFRDAWRQGEVEKKILPLLEGAEELFYSWQEEYRQIRNRYGVFSYSDIILLAQGIASPLWARTYVDEAQDTSLKQRELIDSLTFGPTIFVGDKNQSIYHFRGANARLWQAESEGLPSRVLRDNYRSGKEILKVVEEICRPLLGDDLVKMKGHKSGGEVSLLVNKIPKGTEGASLGEIEARTLLPHVFEKIKEEGYSLSDVAILLPSNNDISDYTRVLRKLKIPCLALRAKGLLRQEECQDMRAALRLLASLDDEEALVRLLSSPFFGWSKMELMTFSDRQEGESIFTLLPSELQEDIFSWRDLLGTRAPSAILRQMIKETSFDLALELLDPTGLKMENVAGFLGILEDIEADVGWSPSLLMDALEEEIAADDEGQENRLPQGLDAVRLLTIHRAKGDEFPVVILGRTSRQGVRVGDKFLLDGQDLGFSLSSKMKSEAYIAAQKEEKSLLEEESRRLFYVALTRAERRLFLLASSWRKGQGFAGPIADSQILESGFPRSEFVASADDREEAGEVTLTEEKEIVVSENIFSEKPTLETLSWSRLASWDECSLRRDLEIIALPGGEIELTGGGARHLGERIHQQLAFDITHGQIDPHGYPDEAQEMIEMLAGSDLWESIMKTEKCETEVPFLFSLGGGKIALRGRIDLLATSGSRGWVLDWKSGEDDHFASQYLLQRKIYALALLKRADIEEVRASTYYLRKRESVEEVYRDRKSLEKEVEDLIKKTLSSPAEPAAKTPQPFCQGCPGLLRICPVSLTVKEELNKS